jgi:hypothetical protein
MCAQTSSNARPTAIPRRFKKSPTPRRAISANAPATSAAAK